MRFYRCGPHGRTQLPNEARSRVARFFWSRPLSNIQRSLSALREKRDPALCQVYARCSPSRARSGLSRRRATSVLAAAGPRKGAARGRSARERRSPSRRRRSPRQSPRRDGVWGVRRPPPRLCGFTLNTGRIARRAAFISRLSSARFHPVANTRRDAAPRTAPLHSCAGIGLTRTRCRPCSSAKSPTTS